MTIADAAIHLEPAGPQDAPLISQSDAISRAAASAGARGDIKKPFSAQLVRLTDLNYAGPNGDLVVVDRLVWLVRFTGTPQPLYGGFDPDTGIPLASLVPPNEIATELNVVIDALSGEMLESFSYR